VLDALRPEFPDVTISKLRFLESEGLVEPARTPSGYRKFSHADVERLRYVLEAQRDHYLALVSERRIRGQDVALWGSGSKATGFLMLVHIPVLYDWFNVQPPAASPLWKLSHEARNP